MVMIRSCLILSLLLIVSFLNVGCGGGGGGGGGNNVSSELVDPSGSEVWGGAETIRWNPAGAITVEIRLSSDGGTSYPNVITSATADDGEFEWDTSRFPDGADYRVQIRFRNRKGNLGAPVASASSFSIDNTAPVVQVTGPDGGDVVFGELPIFWSTTDAHLGTVTLRLSANQGRSFPITIAENLPDTGGFTFNSADVEDGEGYLVQVVASDSAGNVSEAATNDEVFAIVNGAAVESPARFLDMNRNAVIDQNDQLIIPFNTSITVNSVSESDFFLPVLSDRFGASPSFAAGPESNEITVTLGVGPTLTVREIYDVAGNVDASGIDLSESISTDAIENTVTGGDATATVPVDIVPGFVDHPTQIGNQPTQTVALGDFNSDGALDLFTGQGNNLPDRIWWNDGSGGFTDSGQSLGSGETRGSVVGDFDQNGWLDVAVARANGQGNAVYLNDGTGALVWTGEILGGADSRAVAAGDLDADGDLDLVFGNELTGNRVYRNDGSGSFTDSNQSLAAQATRGVALADVDNDTDLDLITANFAQSNRVWINDGLGNFTDSGVTLGADETQSVDVGDLNRDGAIDVVLGGVGESRVWLGDGTGQFKTTSDRIGQYDTRSLKLVDFDRDGDLDIFEVNYGRTSEIWLGDGAGRFPESFPFLDNGPSTSAAIGDLDSDGDQDLAQGRVLGQGDRAWMNSLSGGWGTISYNDSGQELGTNAVFSYGMKYGDLDGDGDEDLVVGRYGKFNEVWFNDQGTFVDSGQLLGAFDDFTWGVDLGDIDGDGDLDLYQSGRVPRLWVNDGSGVFSDTLIDFELGEYSYNGVFFDADNDGDLDLMIGSATANQLWFNVGDGVLVNSGQNLGNLRTVILVPADLDRDGDLDIVSGNQEETIVWFNDGNGVFTDSGQGLGSNLEFEYGISVGDLDMDGDLDLVVASYFIEEQVDRNGLLFYENDGNGFFSLTGSHEVYQCLGTHLGDFDGDGDLDVCLGRYNGEPNLIWINDGTGTFTDSGYTLGNRFSAAILFMDVEQDGDLDVADGSFGFNQIFLHQ